MAELADALDLGASGQPWGFKSPCPYHQETIKKILSPKSPISSGFSAFCGAVSRKSKLRLAKGFAGKGKAVPKKAVYPFSFSEPIAGSVDWLFFVFSEIYISI